MKTKVTLSLGTENFSNRGYSKVWRDWGRSLIGLIFFTEQSHNMWLSFHAMRRLRIVAGFWEIRFKVFVLEFYHEFFVFRDSAVYEKKEKSVLFHNIKFVLAYRILLNRAKQKFECRWNLFFDLPCDGFRGNSLFRGFSPRFLDKTVSQL